MADQRRPDAATLVSRRNGDRAQNEHVDEAPRRVEQRPGEEDMADDGAGVVGHEAEAVDPVRRGAQRRHELRDSPLAEGRLDDRIDNRLVPGPLDPEADAFRRAQADVASGSTWTGTGGCPSYASSPATIASVSIDIAVTAASVRSTYATGPTRSRAWFLRSR